MMPIKTICKKLFVISWICLFSFSLKNDGEILYQSEKGKISIEKDFLKIHFQKSFYYDNQGDYVEIFVFKDVKKMIGSTSEGEFLLNKNEYLNKYQEKIKSLSLNPFDSPKQFLRLEKKNKRIYFYYQEQMVYIDFGKKIADENYCLVGHKKALQIKETNFNVAMYLNGNLKMACSINKKNDQNIHSIIDITKDFRKSEISSFYGY